MRNHLKFGVAALLASLATANLAPGQSPPTANPSGGAAARSQPAPTQDHRPADGGPMLNITFPGGTVGQYVAAVKDASAKAGGAVNVIVPAEAATIELGPMVLEKVRAVTALNAIETAFRRNSEHMFKVEDFNQDSAEAPSFAITYMHVGSNRSARPDRPREDSIEVFSVREIVETLPPLPPGAPDQAKAQVMKDNKQHLLMAIDAALSLAARGEPEPGKDASPASVMYHDESGLLIVRAAPRQIDLVRSVLAQLRDDTLGRRNAAVQRAERAAALSRRAAAAESRVALSQAELSTATARFERLSKMADAGNVGIEQLEEAKLNVERAKVGVMQAEADLANTRADAATISDAGPPSDAGSVGPTPDPVVEQYVLKNVSCSHVREATVAVVSYGVVPGGRESVNMDESRNSVIVCATPPKQRVVRLLLEAVDSAAAAAGKKP
ncbi:MAG: hypothetical protein AB7G11_10020 [Phycisphaerales bacterium]